MRFRYFMFLLSPLYWLSRRRSGVDRMSAEEKQDMMKRAHQVPATPLNLVLAAVFAAEAPLGQWIRFPWGTSLLGVFRKP